MSNRDWQKDWKTCQYGIPGPWFYHVPGRDGEWAGYVYSGATGERVAYDVSFDDGMFIAEAREALPYWLQRVRELEEENSKLREALQNIISKHPSCYQVNEADLQCIVCYEPSNHYLPDKDELQNFPSGCSSGKPCAWAEAVIKAHAVLGNNKGL